VLIPRATGIPAYLCLFLLLPGSGCSKKGKGGEISEHPATEAGAKALR
jgi:hypothetical protein